MYCRNCGSKLEEGNKVCPNCGREININLNLNKEPINVEDNIEYGDKSKVAAGILGILLGGLGVHRMYLGYVGIGVLQLVLTFLTCGISQLWGIIEGILILCGSTITTDAEGKKLRP